MVSVFTVPFDCIFIETFTGLFAISSIYFLISSSIFLFCSFILFILREPITLLYFLTFIFNFLAISTLFESRFIISLFSFVCFVFFTPALSLPPKMATFEDTPKLVVVRTFLSSLMALSLLLGDAALTLLRASLTMVTFLYLFARAFASLFFRLPSLLSKYCLANVSRLFRKFSPMSLRGP